MGGKPSKSIRDSEALGRDTRHDYISGLEVHPVYLLASQINQIRFADIIMASGSLRREPPKQNWPALRIGIGRRHRLNLVSRSQLYLTLVRRLAFFFSKVAENRLPLLKLAYHIASRQHFCGLFYHTFPECSLTLNGHDDWISSVAFHPSGRYLATCSYDKTVKLWRLHRHCTAAECVSKIDVPNDLQGHFAWLTSAEFHPSAPYLAINSANGTSLWRLNNDCTEAKMVLRLTTAPAKCVFYVALHDVAFHPSAPFLATAGADGASLWRLGENCTDAQCVSKLRGQGHANAIHCVAFHPSAPFLTTGSGDGTITLWRLNIDCTTAACVLTLRGHEGSVHSISISEHLLATASSDGTAKLWRLGPNCSELAHAITLQGHSYSVYSIAFHPSAPFLATGSGDGCAKLWFLNSDKSSATCVSTLQGRCGPVRCVVFHPQAACLAAGTDFGGVMLWR